jgi:hypothetical protein
MARPFVSPLAPSRWVFIIGCYNSGTSLLRKILAQHTAIDIIPDEGVLFTDALPAPEPLGWTRMWMQCVDAMRLEPGPDQQARVRRIQRDWRLVAGTAPVVLEKTISNAARVAFLATYFQPAYFLYLVRDGYAVAEGIRRKARPAEWGNDAYAGGYPIEMCARQWVETHRYVQQDRPAATHFLQLHYEDLAENPVPVLNRICSFLDLAPLPDDQIRGSWSVHGVDSPIRNMNPDSHARLSPEDVDRIEQAAASLLRDLGYERPPSSLTTAD